ncbi:MAG TPA: histidinol-phosphate transaminase [Azoarcus sp.]|nr:histidinol-phosphate transaminase [Azoarcus sp.]
MSRYWSPFVHGLDPYVPGEQPRIDKLIKLNTNENPYGPSPRALEAIRNAADDTLRLYPDPQASDLRAALATHHGVEPEQVFVGNGSDEVLAHIFQGLLKHDRPLWMPDITYSFYPAYCGLYGIDFEPVPLDPDFRIRAHDYLPREDARAGGIIFANPNAPTGHALPLNEIEQIVRTNPQCVVVIDEAYVDFGAESAATLVERYANLVAVQTFSKSRSLAGLRIGYAIAQEHLIQWLERVKNCFNSYPLDHFAIAAGVASIHDTEWFNDVCARVINNRETLAKNLRELGFEVLPSAANFVFVRHPERDAAELNEALRERAILVRHFAKLRIDQHLRISVGTDEECAALVHALKEILG